jgi:hypothetical protein
MTVSSSCDGTGGSLDDLGASSCVAEERRGAAGTGTEVGGLRGVETASER